MKKSESIKHYVYSMRPKNWLKNIILFLPLIFSQKLFVSYFFLRVAQGVFIFSLASSAVYIINDILDRKSDSHHPLKRLRPLASGKVSLIPSIFLATILIIFSLIFSYLIMPVFSLLILTYLVSNLIYSLFTKNIILIDIFHVASFFLLRIIAGCVLAEAAMSHWIIFCTTLLAMFLALNKRRYELDKLGNQAILHRKVLAKYSKYFVDQLNNCITTSVIVFYMLYVTDKQTIANYGSNGLLYSVPFVYYGVFRYLYLIHKFSKGGDPVRLLLSDKCMQINIIIWLFICIMAVYF